MSYDTNNFQNFNNYVNELPTSTPRGGAASSAALNSDFRMVANLMERGGQALRQHYNQWPTTQTSIGQTK